MARADMVTTEGVVVEAMRNTTFKVKLDNGHEITAYLSGKLRTNFIRVLAGDRVTVELSIYDPTKGRIIWRAKNERPVVST